MSTWIHQFEAYAGKLLVQHKIPGLSVGLAKNGEMIYGQGFGFRNREEGLPATVSTVHGIGSITKSFTCVAIMQLQERGKLKVNDPVVKYLPEFRTPNPEYTKQVTIHHFMTHTAGLPPLPSLFPAMAASMKNDAGVKNFGLQVEFQQMPEVNTYEELMNFIAETKFEPLGAPGTHFSYSNDGYGLLGAIIERVAGVSYEAYIEENLLKPAGMVNSTFDVEKILRSPELTMLYGPNKEKEGAIEAQPGWWQAPSMLAAGFLRSTVPDMLRYMEIYRTGGMVGAERILSAESVKAMTFPHVEASPGMAYGYGLMLTPRYHGVSLVEHGGGIKGVSAYVTCVPEKGLTGVALANLAGVPSGEILLGGVNAYLGLPVETKRVEYASVDCPADRLAAYAGEYKSLEGASMKVVADGGSLAIEMEGKQFPCRPIGEHAFAAELPTGEMALTFLLDDAGQVKAGSFGFRIVGKVVA